MKEDGTAKTRLEVLYELSVKWDEIASDEISKIIAGEDLDINETQD